MAEQIQKNEEEYDDLQDSDTIPMIYWLFDIWENANNIDTAILGKQKRSQVEQWKEKIWDSLNHYINQLLEPPE